MSGPDGDGSLDLIVEQVRSTAKYASIHPGLVARIAARELMARRSTKETVKATRRRLHQIGAVYLTGTPRYDRWLGMLKAARESESGDQMMDACRSIMTAHQSSRERIPILASFYQQLMGDLGPISRVLDLACGLNPLSAPWMPLASGTRYIAADVFSDLMAFLAEALPLLDMDAETYTFDLLGDDPGPRADVALLLKAVPCLEQVDHDAGARLVASTRAPYVIVSFPTASLGGRRDRGMLPTYRSRMEAICSGHPWRVSEHLFDTELAYVVDKTDDLPREEVA